MAAQENNIFYTQEEQADLRNLNANLELFSLLKTLLTQGSYPGNAAVALIRCQQFAENLIQQTSKQLEEINKGAASRGQDTTGTGEVAATPKSSKKKDA